MTKHEIAILVSGLILLFAGFVTGSGHPAMSLGILTWPFAFLLFVVLIVHIVSRKIQKPFLLVFLITVALYYLIGAILGFITNDQFEIRPFTAIWVLTWPVPYLWRLFGGLLELLRLIFAF